VIVGNHNSALAAKAATARCRPSLRPGATRLRTASSPASTGREATSQAGFEVDVLEPRCRLEHERATSSFRTPLRRRSNCEKNGGKTPQEEWTIDYLQEHSCLHGLKLSGQHPGRQLWLRAGYCLAATTGARGRVRARWPAGAIFCGWAALVPPFSISSAWATSGKLTNREGRLKIAPDRVSARSGFDRCQPAALIC
jgi:hypothetical protein